MSDDYVDCYGGRIIGHDDMNAREAAVVRIAVHARTSELANDFWRQLEKRLQKKAKLSVSRWDSAGSDASIHFLDGDDFADANATDSALLRIATNVAPVNVLIEPAISDPDRRQRTKDALADLTGSDYVRFASENDAQSAWSTRSVRAVAKFLMQRFAALGLLPEEYDGPPRRQNANEPSDSPDGTVGPRGAERNAIRSFKSPSGTANDHSARKTQKRAERIARKIKKKRQTLVQMSQRTLLRPRRRQNPIVQEKKHASWLG